MVAINNSGQFAGNSSLTNLVVDGQGVDYSKTTGWAHAFIYNGHAVIDLGTLGSNFSTAKAINNHGDVVGYSGILPLANPADPNQINHAFLVQSGGKMIDLGVLRGTTQSIALGINDSGQIVGYSGAGMTPTASYQYSLTSHAFLYQNGALTDLIQRWSRCRASR